MKFFINLRKKINNLLNFIKNMPMNLLKIILIVQIVYFLYDNYIKYLILYKNIIFYIVKHFHINLYYY